MTTPNQVSSAGGITQNELTMTQAAAQAFEETTHHLLTIYNSVTDSNMALNSAMISTSSTMWQQNTQQWSDDFNALVGNLQSITDMLNLQVARMQQNEDNNTSLMSGISQVGGGAALA